PAPRGASAWTELGLKGIEQFAQPLVECEPPDLWRGEPPHGIGEDRGEGGAAAFAERHDGERAGGDKNPPGLVSVPLDAAQRVTVEAYWPDARRFDSGKQVSAYAGRVPRQYQSGELDRRGRITRRGPGLLRKMLVECAWCALRYNRWAQTVYARLCRGKTRKK